MTGLETSSMSVVKWIKAIRQSPEIYIENYREYCTENGEYVSSTSDFMLHWNRLDTK